jgi:hypothetical protein
VTDNNTGKKIYAIVGDVGGEGSYHEMSIKAVWDLGYQYQGRNNNNIPEAGDFTVTYFPGSNTKWNSMAALENGLNGYARWAEEDFNYRNSIYNSFYL